MTEVPIWFGPDDRPVFGWLSVPAAGTASAGVVLCPPMTEEARATHRTFRTLGERLARRGILALRLDYRGTGDSSGWLTDPNLVADWLEDVAHAVAELRRAGVGRVGAVGMRLGATIVANASAETGLDDVVLWDPCLSGNSFLREGQALYSMSNGPALPSADRGRSATERDSVVDTPGFRFPAALAADLATLELRHFATGARRPRRTLVLPRADRPVSPRLRRQLTGDGLSWHHALGQAELLDVPPSAATVPTDTLDYVVDWISEGSSLTRGVPVRAAARAESVLRAADGTPVRERAAVWTDHRLFGMVTEPVTVGPTQRRLPWLLFLNVAAEHHIGPGRQWVELARSWAALGYRCVRLDLSGIGDSPTRPGQTDNVIFAPAWLDDVPSVVAELAADGSEVVVVGLCSGAHAGMEAALVTRVRAILGINARMSAPEMSPAGPLFDARRRAARPPTRSIGRIGLRHRRIGGGIWRIYRQIAFWHAPLSAVAQVAATGTELLLIANPEDAREFSEVAVWTLLGRPRLRRNPRYRAIVDPDVDHSLLTHRAQRVVGDLFTAFLLDRFGSAPPDRIRRRRSPVVHPAHDLPVAEFVRPDAEPACRT